MAKINKLLRANRTVLLVPLIEGTTEPQLVGPTGTLTPFSDPAAAVLTAWAAVLTTSATGAQQGGNISCALLDDLDLGLADSEYDTELTICSIGNEQEPTFYNVDATLTAFRDASVADTGVFNLATQLMNAKGVRYAIVDRLGYASSAAFASGQEVSIYDATTDNPVDIKEDRGNLKIQQTPKPSGLVNVNKTLS